MATISSQNSRANILLICVDHWPGRLLGCRGHQRIMTPTIDLFAQNGVLFEQAYSACPVCVPARRTLMTGLSSKNTGVRKNVARPMSDAPTLASTFADAGYRTQCVGKLHVEPQQNKIGFHDVLLNEEGRHSDVMPRDDWEKFLDVNGFSGMEYAGGGTQNDYVVTPWHLPEHCHQTSWTGREMARMIAGRDKARPHFWYMSFAAPHPPLWPLRSYLDMYMSRDVGSPVMGDWARDFRENPPSGFVSKLSGLATTDAPLETIALARRAFFAMCTHVDHQIRAVLGTLRESGALADTIIAFVSDHGDMLGDHGLWGKTTFYEGSSHIPFVIVPHANGVGKNSPLRGSRSQKIAELRDVMPTLLSLAGLPLPSGIDGIDLLSEAKREYIFGECGDNAGATRMIRDERHKLIYYPAGNRFQLFDIKNDPLEMRELSSSPRHAETLCKLQETLRGELYGEDVKWHVNGKWVGLENSIISSKADLGYAGQRGYRFP